jgi:monoamine oxidase
MFETVIVGGGLSGLVLAKSLWKQGRSCMVFEARERLGGRILSVPSGRVGLRVDLGPSWFWPESQPLITRLVAELGLEDFPQPDDGSALVLRDPDKRPDTITGDSVHGGAWRIQGGMARLVEEIVRGTPSDLMCLGHELTAVHDRGEHVELRFRHAGRWVIVAARQVVLAMPPRLIEETISFEPALGEPVRHALRDTATWMAARAKFAVGYEQPLWRGAGLSGNGFVTHEQAVAGEVFDACGNVPGQAALGGFLALSPVQREDFSVGLPLLIDNQIAQLFGPELGDGELLYQDWATEGFTCAARDRDEPDKGHEEFASPLLRAALWGGKVYFGGSETAAHGSGYMEGALDAARRIERALTQSRTAMPQGDADAANAVALERFGAWVALQGDVALNSYRQRLNRSLASQQRDQLTQRALLGAVEEVYCNALAFLDDLGFQAGAATVERGRSALTPLVQAPFGAFMKTLLDDVTAFNKTSCALSNFPGEDRLSNEYMQTILRDIAAAWQEFSLSANALLLTK